MMDDIRFNTHTDAPIRARPLHDAHVLLILMLFFIGVALPIAWHTVVALSLALAVLARIQGMTWRSISFVWGWRCCFHGRFGCGI